MNKPLISAANLTVTFKTPFGPIFAVDGVSFELGTGKTLGIVGESGSGKSTIANAIVNLVESSGDVVFDGIFVRSAKGKQRKELHRRIAMVYQDPMASLDPRRTIGSSVLEPMEVHGLYRGRREEKLAELLDMVGLDPSLASRYPRQLSGGQRQRACIARALASDPDLIILDEATASLDVSVQAQILNLLKRLQREQRISYLFISHDLAVVNHMSDQVIVLYLGKTMELVSNAELFAEGIEASHNARHPYTRSLLSAIPPVDVTDAPTQRIVLVGDLPSPANPPSGCVFRTRCPIASSLCAERKPEMVQLSPTHTSACHRVEEIDEVWQFGRKS